MTSTSDDDQLLATRHFATQHIMRYFAYAHLPRELQPTSMACAFLAKTMMKMLPDGPELTAGLRKLLEAKDCFVRAAHDAFDEEEKT